MKGLAKYIRPYWGFICLTMLIKLLGAVLELWIPSLMEVMLDEKAVSGDANQIWLFGGLMILCAAGCLAMNILSNRMSAVSSGKITRKIRYDLFNKLQHLSARQMDEITVSSAESRLTSDTYNVNQMLARIQRMGIRAPSLLIGGIIMMLTMDPVMALLMVALLPFIVLVVLVVTKYSVPLHTRQQTVLDKVVRVVQENITGIRVIKALSKTEYEKGRFNEVNTELSDVGLRAGMVTGITNPISSLILRIGLTLAVVIGAMRVDSGKVKITTLGNDDRVFPFGRFLRKSKLDETPQILNILKGDMSIVGFRPEDEANAAQVFEGDYQKILSIKPGLTSPASLLDYTHGERYESEEAYIQEFLPLKMEMELYYAENKRFFYDLRLIFRTAKIILQKIFGKEDFPYPPEYAAVADRLAAKQNASATEPTTAQKG